MDLTTCPNREQLAAYLLGTAGEPEAESIAAHLDACATCEATIQSMEGVADTVVARLRQESEQTPYAGEPEYRQALDPIYALEPATGSGTGEATTAPTLPGQLGDYQIVGKLGQGGMGAVFKAVHTRLRRTVAIKILPKSPKTDPHALVRFQREMAAVGGLDHPNIVRAHDAREIGGTHFLVMEYVDGLDLAEIARRHGPLPVADACEMIRQAALGLQYAHEHGLVHRDIKPSNLMLTIVGQAASLPARLPEEHRRRQREPAQAKRQAGSLPYEAPAALVKILDLGLALLKAQQPAGDEPTAGPPTDADLTSTRQIMGTATYMAPEQASDSHQVDIRADIYSLGCTLYKLLAGRPPFPTTEHKTAIEQITAHRTKPVEPIEHLRPEVPDRLAAVVGRMLAKNPADRFATPVEVAAALEPWAQGSDLVSLLTGVPAQREPAAILPAARAKGPPLPLGEGQGEGAPSRSRPRRLRRFALVAGSAAAILLLGIFLTVSTGKGTVQLEFSDAEAARRCTIFIDGDEIGLQNLGEPIKLRPGKHELRVLHGDLEIETREFDILRQGHHVLHVSIPAMTIATPRPAQAHASRAIAHYDKGEFSQAIAAYSEAIRLDRNVAEHYLGRGKSYAASAEVDRAIADFGEAIRLEPANFDALAGRAVLFSHDKHDPGNAVPDVQAAIRIRPDCARDFMCKWRFYERRGQITQGAAETNKFMLVLQQHGQPNVPRSALGKSESGALDQVLLGLRRRVALKNETDADWLHWLSSWLPTVTRDVEGLAGMDFVSDMPWLRSTCGFNQEAMRNRPYGHCVHIGGLPYWKGIRTHAFEENGRPADVVVDISRERFARFKAQVGNDDPLGTVQFQVLVDGKVKAETPVLRSGKVQAISADVAGAKELVLRVLNGGDGCTSDSATWGLARLVRAGAEDPLEVPPAELESATHANAALFLAEVHWRLGHKDLARRWFDKATAWMDKNPTRAETLRRYRAEAAKLLGIPETPSTAKEKPQAK
jgi:serine/threonine protein kinase/tetratricopeptide (TPR) repeat protein